MLAGLIDRAKDDFSGLLESMVKLPPNSSKRPWIHDRPRWEILKLIPACAPSTAYSPAVADEANPSNVANAASAILGQRRCNIELLRNSKVFLTDCRFAPDAGAKSGNKFVL